ncbi:MAG: hypothetical protein IAE65_10410 [Ignavibacteria bacterium]|nr:hypothetical protein [Ignavibacteria bacterium]
MGDQFELDYFNIDIRGYHSSIDALNNYNQKRGNSKRYSPEYEIDEIEISP